MGMDICHRMTAIIEHGDQRYGDFPYAVHLAHVEHILAQFGYASIDYRRAAWLHDILEDTSYTRKQLRTAFGTWVDEVVWACSGFGENRKARNACIKEKILLFPEAAVVKCADRIANVEFSANSRKPGIVKRYIEELPDFAEYIKPNVPELMWARLERSCFDRVK